MSSRSFASPRFAPALLLAGAGLALGCARGPDVQVNGLALRRVVIYRNGVGYFEREGHIQADEVTFKVRKERVGDFLATLAVIEQGGSSVRSASFPVALDKANEDDDEEEEASDRRFEVLLKPPPHKKKDDKKDKLETVHLTLDGQEHDLVIGYVAETPVWRPSYRLVIDTKAQAAGKPPAAPGTGADLQAWGIVQNTSGEDWKGVRLSLVAGAPLAFQATLEKPVIPARPVVTDQGEVISSVPTSETSLGEAPPPPPPPPPGAPAPDLVPRAGGEGHTIDELLEKSKEEAEVDKDVDAAIVGNASKGGKKRAPAKSARAGAGGWGGPAAPASAAAVTRRPMGRAEAAPAAPPPPPAQNPSPPRNMRALAAIAMEGGTTKYVLPFTVDIPDKSATMVLLTAKRVPGESIFLYSPDGGVPESASHPFRVARFTNDTKGLLERGPIAVFEDGAFLGQGMVDPLPPGATATVPFALERSLAVERTQKENEEGSRLARIESGQLVVERDWVTHTKYTVKNGGDLDAHTLVKHPRLYDTRLNNPPKGTEDNVGTGSALVPVDVPRRTTAVLDVDERRVRPHNVDWLDQLADDAVKGYLADKRADPALAAQLRAAWEARTKLRASLDEKDKIQAERNQLEIQSEELRNNLRAIEKNKTADALRKDLTDRLARDSARLDEITKRAIVLDMQVNEQLIRFRDLINPIKMLKPLPVP